MTQCQAHKITVDTLLGKLRRVMLGYMTPCLPEHVCTRSQQRRAIRVVVERLTLCFALTNSPVSTEVLQACRSRLYAIITYLYFECLRADQTFDGLLKLAALDAGVLMRMAARARHTPRSFLRHYRRIPEAVGNMESTVLLLLAQDSRLPPGYICSLAAERALDTMSRNVA